MGATKRATTGAGLEPTPTPTDPPPAPVAAESSPVGPRAPTPPPAAVLVLGLGNDMLSDDAMGLNVVRELRRRLPLTLDVAVKETGEMGLGLLDLIEGYRELIVVDSIQTGKAAPGYLHEFEGAALPVTPSVSPHCAGIGEMLALGAALGLVMPERVTIFAVEVQDPFTLGNRLTPVLEAALPEVTRSVETAVRARQGLSRGHPGPGAARPVPPPAST